MRVLFDLENPSAALLVQHDTPPFLVLRRRDIRRLLGPRKQSDCPVLETGNTDLRVLTMRDLRAFIVNCRVQVYDRKVKPKYFIGQFTLSLIPLIPWVTDVATALEDVKPAKDYEDSIDLKKIGQRTAAFHLCSACGRSSATSCLEELLAYLCGLVFVEV